MSKILKIFVRKPIETKNVLKNEYIYRYINFWNKSQNTSKSSNSVVKLDPKVSLAYYSIDPHFLSKTKANPILMYHNLFTSKEMYKNIVKPLAQKTERAVYLLDMRNHGESPHTDVQHSDLNTMAKDVNDFMDEFKINKAVLMGHGVGGQAMLRTSLLFGDRVEKVAAIDTTHEDLSPFGSKLTDLMIFTISSLPQNINLSFAKLIVKQQLNRHFRDKTLLQYILMNLKVDDKGFIKWKFNLPVIRQLLFKRFDRFISTDSQYSGDVLIFSGKYDSITSDNYMKLKNSFPNSKFDFYRRFGHYINVEKPKQILNVLVSFVGKSKINNKND